MSWWNAKDKSRRVNPKPTLGWKPSKHTRYLWSVRRRELWKDPIYKDTNMSARKASPLEAARRSNHSDKMVAFWANNENRIKQLSLCHSQKANMKRRRAMKAHFRDPVYVAAWKEWMNKRPARLEVAMACILRKAKIRFREQFGVGGFIADFVLSGKVIIECDGEYWHSRIDIRKHDKQKMGVYYKEGYIVLRFSEREIFDRPKAVLAKVVKTVNVVKRRTK